MSPTEELGMRGMPIHRRGQELIEGIAMGRNGNWEITSEALDAEPMWSAHVGTEERMLVVWSIDQSQHSRTEGLFW